MLSWSFPHSVGSDIVYRSPIGFARPSSYYQNCSVVVKDDELRFSSRCGTGTQGKFMNLLKIFPVRSSVCVRHDSEHTQDTECTVRIVFPLRQTGGGYCKIIFRKINRPIVREIFWWGWWWFCSITGTKLSRKEQVNLSSLKTCSSDSVTRVNFSFRHNKSGFFSRIRLWQMKYLRNIQLRNFHYH